MTDTDTKKPTKPTPPLVAAGFAALIAGCLAWLWLGDWRFALTGAGVLLVLGVAANVRRPPL